MNSRQLEEEEVHLIPSGAAIECEAKLQNPFYHFISKHFHALLLALASFVLVSIIVQIQSNKSNPLPKGPEILEIQRNFPTSRAKECSIQPNFRIDCIPDDWVNKRKCLDRGCCWNRTVEVGVPGQPYCYFSKGFSYYEIDTPHSTDYGLETLATFKSAKPSAYSTDIRNLRVQVYYESDSSVRIKISDNNSERYEVPLHYKCTESKSSERKYSVEFHSNGFKVFRNDDNTTALFDSTIGPLIYSHQFLQISTTLPSEYFYGIGETIDTLKRNINWTRTVLWNRDINPPAPYSNLYGSHPFYMALDENGLAHGVFLANSNAMEVILQPAPALTFRTIGGILDVRIYTGPTPAKVMEQYTDTIGKPFLPPYWALGFHLVRCAYNYTSVMYKVLKRNLDVGIPIDVQWNDIDYLYHPEQFHVDEIHFSRLKEYVEELHFHGMRYVPVVDPGISISELPLIYPPRDLGQRLDIFVKDARSGKPFLSMTWYGNATYFPDYTHPNITEYWGTLLDYLYNQVSFDGIWVDSDETHSIWNGDQNGTCNLDSNLDHPPYTPHVVGGYLYDDMMCASALHFNKIPHYDLHNIYGTLESKVTFEALAKILPERQFAVTRSTFPGAGQYAGHWTGDVRSSWEDMKQSIPQILTFGLFGIPFIGADICGYHNDTTVELCKRWSQLGAFYPFSRNHNDRFPIDQDPAALGPEVVAAARETMRLRYTLLPYLYTLFFHAHFYGEPVARALFYEFPHDKNTYNIEHIFMWGSSILIIPILHQNQTELRLAKYLPKGLWYPHYDDVVAIKSQGEEMEIRIPEEVHSIPILYRGGSIIMTQKPGLNTVESRKNPFTLHVYLSEEGLASGELYWDDGVSPLPKDMNLHTYIHYKMTLKERTLLVVAEKNTDSMVINVEEVEVCGINATNISIVHIFNRNWDGFIFNSTTKILLIQALKEPLILGDEFSISWFT